MSNLQAQLAQLRDQIFREDSPEIWKQIEQTCHQLGNTLRTKDPDNDNHAALGNTPLPQHLKDLFSLALHQRSTPTDEFTSVTLEILRVAANLCMDHDENRGHLLEAMFPQTVVAMLEGYVENLKATRVPLSIPHLKVSRTAMGVLLNLSIGYEPVKSRLKSLEVAETILSLSSATYVPGEWLRHLDTIQDPSSEELWILRTGLANWTWRVISELQDDDSLQIFSAGILPLLTPPLLTFIPTEEDVPVPPISPLVNSLIRADFETLEESCTLIESLSLDVQDVRLALARGLDTPAEHNGVPCLWNIVDFVEKGDYPKLWSRPDADEQRLQKAFDMCKTACIKAIVEVAGEEGNAEVIWDESNEIHPGGAFVERMAGWVKKYAAAKESDTVRDDLIICASLSLGNLARREVHARVLLSPPHLLAPVILSPQCLSISTDTKLKHGVLGLLRHLAQSTPHNGLVHEALTREKVVHRIAESGVWDEKADAMAEVVQVSAIGVIKAVCNASADNTFMAILPAEAPPTTRPTALNQILALVKRADTVTIKSEGTRAIVNMVRSLWSSTTGTASTVASPVVPAESNADSLEKAKKRQDCIQALSSPECVLALATQIERSTKHPLLINEGVVALSLLGSYSPSSLAVLQALVKPIGVQQMQSADGSVSTDITLVEEASTSSNTASRRALDMLVTVIECPETVRFPVEVRINACSLLAQISRNNTGASELQAVKDATKDVVSVLVEKYKVKPGKEGILAAAAQKLLGTWA